MPAVAIDTNRLFRALKSTGKSENFSAEDLVSAFDAAQTEGDWVTRAYFDARLAGVDAMGVAIGTRVEARMDVFDAKLDTMRAELRLDVKSGQLQNLFWLAGIILVSNGALIALMARVARLY